MEPILGLAVLLGFFVTLFFMPFWIRKAKEIGLVWKDMHKRSDKKVAGSGGIGVVLGFVLGVLFYVAIKTFYFESMENLIEIFALLTSMVLIAGVGFIDDLFGWQHGGLSKRSRLILVLFSAIPLMVINAGESMMMSFEMGILYPLVFIPIGLVGASATYNFLAGYNGLESSQGIIILSALGIVTWLTGTTWLSLILFIMVSCLLAFYLFNKSPASVFPGDVLTYSIGAMIAITAILGNVEKIAIFFFIPYILETGLKARGRLKKQSFGRLNSDGTLEMPYDKIYGLEHLAIFILKKIKRKGRVYENDVVYLINLFQIFIIILGFVLFRGSLF